MSQKHYKQDGTFHITTNSKKDIPWCTWPGIPEILIDNLFMTRNVQNAKVYSFCIMPDHMHILLSPGEKGLSAFMHSFKRNAMWDIRKIISTLRSGRSRSSAPAVYNCIPKWQKGFYDERIRTSDQRTNALNYIKQNPIKNHLVTNISDWPWHSIHFEHLLDSTDFWFDSPFDPN